MNKDLSVILAIRNEEGFIHKCLDSLINQDLSKERYEIIVIDGMSDDKTRAVLSQYQTKHPSLITILDNPKKIQAVGWNIGSRKARGRILQIFGGHSVAHSNYLSTIIKKLDNVPSDVIGAGGIFSAPDDEKFFGKVMSDVQGSILGGFGTTHRIRSKTNVECVPFPAYRKDLVEKIGAWFDERLVMAQDLDLCLRIKKAGFKMLLCPEAKIFYYRRHSSLKLLSKRMFKYGMWRMLITKKHPKSFRIHLFFPGILIISMALLPLFVSHFLFMAQIIAGGLITYLLAILASSVSISIKRKQKKYMISFAVYITEHFSYGFGTIVGLFKKLPSAGR